MKKTFALLAVAGLVAVANADVIISEVVDGDLTGGNPKFVELTNTGVAAYVFGAGDSVQVYSNGSVSASATVSLSGVSIAPGASYVIASSANDGITQWGIAYGGAPNLFTGSFFSNGDDVYALNIGGTVVDSAGQIGVDGTGTGWEYLDSYGFRNPTSITQGAFNLADWTFGGVAALDGPDDATRVALLQANTTPGTHVFIPTPGALALLGLGGLVGGRRRR
jgi:uncharacterized protein (TIGR03382 family)